MPNPPLSRSMQLQRLALALFIIMVGLLIGVFTLLGFQQARKSEEDKLSTQASLVATNLQLNLRSANHVLEETLALLDFVTLEQQRERMQSLVNAMPIIRGIGILDSQGIQLVGTRQSTIGADFSERPYFRNAQADPQRQRLYISTPFKGVTGQTSIALSKAILNQQNAFQGVTFAVLEADYIEMLMGSTLYTPDMWAALMHVDSGDAIRVGAIQPGHNRRAVSDEELRDLLPRLMKDGRVTFVSDAGHEGQIIAASVITGYAGNADRPLLIVMGRSHEDAMTAWRRLAYIQTGLFALFALFSGGGLLFYQRRRRQYDARRAADQRLMKAREQDYRLIVERTADCVLRLDSTGRYSYVNPAFSSLFGPAAQQASDNFLDLVVPEDREEARQNLEATLHQPAERRFQVRCATRQGIVHMEWTLCSIPGEEDRITGISGVGRDVSANIAIHDALRSRAHHDSLTGLINRGYFLEIATTAIEHAQRQHQPLAIVMIDLDHFKSVNDTWGHHGGDIALQTCAQTLRQQCREGDVAARLGGEEFTVLLPSQTEDALLAAERIRAAIAAQPVTLTDGREFHLTASIGVAGLQKGENLESLLQRADMALYTAKQQGRNRVVAAAGEAGDPDAS